MESAREFQRTRV